jgi:hypothetical protein
MNMDFDTTLAAHLEQLVVDLQFTQLSRELNRFTPFRVLQVEHYELRHTNTLAWLLDPHASHGIKHGFLDPFLRRVLGAGAPLASPLVEVRTELVLRADDALVADEDRADEEDANSRDRLDILVEGRACDGRPWTLAIEAKIGSQEGRDQLLRYDQALSRHAPGSDIAKCYLTLGAVDAVSSALWQAIYWNEHVGGALQEALATCPDMDARVRDFLNDYQELIRRLSGDDEVQTSQAAQLANRSDVAPVLRALNGRIKEKRTVHSWDAEPWAACYRRHKVALDACRNEVREAGAVLVWDLVDAHFGDGEKWVRLTEKAGKNLAVRFVPRSWAGIEGMRTDGRWNLFYHAEFRRKQGDIEIKLYVARPGHAATQKALLLRLFGPELRPRSDDQLAPSPGYLQAFVYGAGLSVKLYTQTIAWQERNDGTLTLGDQLHDALATFELAAQRHSAALLGLPAAAQREA